MAMVRITPLPVRVRTDWFSGRPLAIQLATTSVPVVAVESVRSESAAYPAATGPRTVFRVLTPDARYALSYEHQRRRWLVEALDMHPDRSSLAA
ncbi:MAG: hypothetical protein ACRDF7_02390 [Candidatus Limnocylindrales bacterium]